MLSLRSMKDYWPIALENVGITACFVALAIYFNHWWIVLFALLGWTSVKFKQDKSN